MGSLSFTALYAACLAVCVGSIELLQGAVDPDVPSLPPQPVEQVAVAVPPRPEGVREVHGDGDDGYRYTEVGCRERQGEFRDVCFHQLARQRASTDLPGGLAGCDKISAADTVQECMADVAELYAPVDRHASLAVCPTIRRPKWRDQCVFGIALALSTIDSPWAFRQCDDAGRWRDFCRHDVNGEIAQVNPTLALENCHAEEGDLLTRKSCWHGIGKYIARVDVQGAFDACEQVPLGPPTPDGYRENCVHGLGWGAAEKAGREFAAECSRAGAFKDSCLVGVAYNLRRFDVAAGLEVCSGVRDALLRARCDEFVTAGAL
jgi:hypothetical protein